MSQMREYNRIAPSQKEKDSIEKNKRHFSGRWDRRQNSFSWMGFLARCRWRCEPDFLSKDFPDGFGGRCKSGAADWEEEGTKAAVGDTLAFARQLHSGETSGYTCLAPHQQQQRISSNSASAATVHQQQQRISSICASAHQQHERFSSISSLTHKIWNALLNV